MRGAAVSLSFYLILRDHRRAISIPNHRRSPAAWNTTTAEGIKKRGTLAWAAEVFLWSPTWSGETGALTARGLGSELGSRRHGSWWRRRDRRRGGRADPPTLPRCRCPCLGEDKKKKKNSIKNSRKQQRGRGDKLKPAEWEREHSERKTVCALRKMDERVTFQTASRMKSGQRKGGEMEFWKSFDHWPWFLTLLGDFSLFAPLFVTSAELTGRSD